MKTLIVEDDFTSRLLLQEFLKSYGPSHIAVNDFVVRRFPHAHPEC
jgi:CheY-like chemotaxis protein